MADNESKVRDGLDRQAAAEVQDHQRLGARQVTHEEKRRELAKLYEREERKRSDRKGR